MMAILRCGMLLSVLSYQILAIAVAQNACVYSVGTMGICRHIADCKELHHTVLFQNDACKGGTYCCPNPSINAPWDNDQKINPPIAVPGIPVIPANSVNPYKNYPFNVPGILFNTVGQSTITVNTERPTRTTPTPITTTTEAIPNFDEEFYRRLGIAFGNKYNPYHQQDVVTPQIDVETPTVSVIIIEEVTTNTSSFMSNLNQLGLHKLSLQKCGFVHIASNPSVSNTEANLLEFPWLALLRYNSESKRPNFMCGGSLITERWVLTAASCIRETLIGVRLGEYKITDKSSDCVRGTCTYYKDYKIAISVKHADYKPETGVKDIALIKLKTRVQINKNIKTICLPTKVEHFNVPYDNEPVTISGWGLKKEGATEVMKKHAVNRSKLQVCHQANPEQRVEQSKLCLTTRYEEPSTCSGDHGGPITWLVNNNTQFFTQIGVVPYGMDKCGAAEGDVSAYYVESVADSMDWITTVIGEDQ